MRSQKASNGLKKFVREKKWRLFGKAGKTLFTTITKHLNCCNSTEMRKKLCQSEIYQEGGDTSEVDSHLHRQGFRMRGIC